MTLIWEPVWNWPAVILVSAALLLMAAFAYPATFRQLPVGQRRWMRGLRLFAAALLVLGLVRPAFEKRDRESGEWQVLIVNDTSRSMNTKDMAGGQTRYQVERAQAEALVASLAKAQRPVTVRQFDFDDTAKPVAPERSAGEGQQTAIGRTLEGILRETQSQRTLAVILQSDGAQRALPPNDADPRPMARQFGDQQIPIYTVGYGATALSTTSTDLALSDLLVDPIVFERKRVPVTVRLRALGAAGRTARVRLLVESRLGKVLGESGPLEPASATGGARPSAEVDLSKASEIVPVELSFIPELPGEVKIAVEVETLEGELLTHNNRLETVITVRAGGLKVAYFDRLRWEQKFLKMLGSEEQIQLDFQEVRAGKFQARTAIPADWFEPGRYDVYIIGDVPAEVFGLPILQKLASRLDEGAGLMMIGGFQNFSGGNYQRSPLVNYLPVKLPNARPPDLTDPLAMRPTDLGQRRYAMLLGTPDRNRELWQGLPLLEGANALTPANELVEVWAESEKGAPLLIAAEVGKARVLASAVDSTYQWVLHGHAAQHQRFWRQVVFWLARREEESQQPVWVKVEPRNYAPGAVPQIEFGARDAQGAPLADAQFTVEVTNPEGTRLPVSPRDAGGSHVGSFTQTAVPGDYWVRVTARQNGVSAGLDGLTRFIVDPRDLELDNPVADYDLLRDISSLSGGEPVKPEELGDFAARLEKMTREDAERVEVVTLWDNSVLLAFFVGALSVEWYLRKRRGWA